MSPQSSARLFLGRLLERIDSCPDEKLADVTNAFMSLYQSAGAQERAEVANEAYREEGRERIELVGALDERLQKVEKLIRLQENREKFAKAVGA